MKKKQDILYVAYHYPPILGSSGVHRTLVFTRHLANQGWRVRVLTASLQAYRNWSAEQFDFIPENVEVIRGFARDTARHFSWRQKYLGFMALPDNWQSWILGGTLSGLWSVIKRRPGIIYSTYPIASAHFIGYFLHKLTGVPWVAELRDPMAQDDYPADLRARKWFQWIERKIVKHCQYAVVTAPGAKAFYLDKFPDCPDSFWRVLPNGYDEEIMSQVEGQVEAGTPEPEVDNACSKTITMLHSGAIYPKERDPRPLFNAIKALKDEGVVVEGKFELRLRATGHDHVYLPQLEELGITSIVKLEPSVPYMKALSEMYEVDGLLLLQAANCNYQIPAKVYEYIKVQKPVLALTPTEGDTGRLLLGTGNASLADLSDAGEIKKALANFIEKIEQGGFTRLSDDEVKAFSRQHQAEVLESILNEP